MSKTLKQSRLGAVRTGRQKGARRFCFYGPESVGKTTLAAHAPKPIFIDIEDGSNELDVARYVFDHGDVVPRNYQEVLDAIHDLIANEHDFKTLVIDSLDRLEALIWSHCVTRDSGKMSSLNPNGKQFTSIESYGSGKGYALALDELRALMLLLENLRKRKDMNIVFVGHTHVKMFNNPSGENYDRYWLRVHQSFAGQTKEWVDVVGFCCFDEGGDKLDARQTRAKGWSTGRRLLKLERDAAYDAKSRIPLPKEIELNADNPWEPLAQAIAVGEDMSVKEILELLKVELERIDDPELTGNVKAACKGEKDTARLSRYLMELKNRNAKEEIETNE
jgi:hypothetical protein